MPFKRFIQLMAAGCMVIALSSGACAQDYFYRHTTLSRSVLKDLEKLLPRAMGYYIYRNQDDFMRGITFMTRQIQTGPAKNKDIEEIRREAYARLMRDIPYCIEAFKGGEIKLDTSASNLANRLGMIAFSIMMTKAPDFPDLEYTERFLRAFGEAISDNLIDIWVFYDGYGDFNSLGELMERLRTPDTMPELRLVRNPEYPERMRRDPFAMFQPPPKHERRIIVTDIDMNNIYNDIINDIMATYVYIWKCSGMDLAHPSYTAPPGTIIARRSSRRQVIGGTISRSVRGGAGTPASTSKSRSAKVNKEESHEGPVQATAISTQPAEFTEGESTITSVGPGPTRMQWGSAQKKNMSKGTGSQSRLLRQTSSPMSDD